MKIEIEFKDQKELEDTINQLDYILTGNECPTYKLHLLLDKLSETIE